MAQAMPLDVIPQKCTPDVAMSSKNLLPNPYSIYFNIH
jgi:hypothetical protein